MARLNVVSPAQASGRTKELYDAITRAVGGVPNIYQGIGNSAAALGGLLGIGAALKTGQLTPVEIEAIKLAVSQAYGCTYCLAAHTMLGAKAGLSASESLELRRGSSSRPGLAALVNFVGALIHPSARVADEQLSAVKAAGYSDAQITEAVLIVAETVFTNLFNRVHQTPLDFPAAPAL